MVMSNGIRVGPFVACAAPLPALAIVGSDKGSAKQNIVGGSI